MKINHEELKIGQKYFITDPDSERVEECILEDISLRGVDNDTIRYTFCYNMIDKDGDNVSSYINLESKDGEEIFNGEFIKIEIYSTKEEAEASRVRILIEGTQALMEDYKKDVIECEAKILKLKEENF